MISKDGAVCAHLVEHGYHLLALRKGAHCVWIRKDKFNMTDRQMYSMCYSRMLGEKASPLKSTKGFRCA